MAEEEATGTEQPMGTEREEEEEEEEEEDVEGALEDRVFQLVHELMTPLADEDTIKKLNLIAETLEEVETSFRKERTPPYRREGHLIGNLLATLDQFEEFYPMLERKLSEVTDNRVRAAVCRVLLATAPANNRMIVRMMYEEDILDRICEWACDAQPMLRCYSTGILSIGLRDRSIANIVVNKDTPITFLKRARLYASKLDKERQMAVRFIQDHLRAANLRHRKNSSSGINTTKGNYTVTTRVNTGIKRKFAASDSRGGGSPLPTEETPQQAAEDSEDALHERLSAEEEQISRGTESFSVLPDPDFHEEELKRLVMLELLYTLDCIGSTGEYLELFAPALKEDIVGTIITFLHSKNPMVLSHVMKLSSHYLAHKKFAFCLIDSGGVELILSTFKMEVVGQAALLHRSISMCLHGFASSAAVTEKILLYHGDQLLSVALNLLSSPNDRARQNAVVFFGLTVPFKMVLDFFDKNECLYTLLNIIRAGNTPRSSAQRQLSHDACLCLRQYLRAHMAFLTHRLRRRLSLSNHHAVNRGPNSGQNSTGISTGLVTSSHSVGSAFASRVSRISSSKSIDVDDKTHEQNLVFFEKHRFSIVGNLWSAASSNVSSLTAGMWPPAAKLSHLRGTLVMMEVIDLVISVLYHEEQEEGSSLRVWIVERAQFCLDALRVLTLVVPNLANEICTTEVSDEEDDTVKRCGMTILLQIAMSTNARDSDLVRDALRVLCNCVSPPHVENCWQHPHKDIREFTLTARSMRGGSRSTGGKDVPSSGMDCGGFCCTKAKEDKYLRPVRKLARENNAIKVCVQLLRYKRSVQNADAIRLLATRVLLGLSRDKQIAQILEKMQIGQLLSDLIRNEPALEENADLHVRFRECALDLISQVTHRAPNAVINEAADPTVRKIEKASIVAQTKITFDSQELLRLIHDHLVTKGLTKTAQSLDQEADLGIQHSDPSITTNKSPEKTPRRSRSQSDVGSHAAASPETPRPSKLPRLELSPRKTSENTTSASSITLVSTPSKSNNRGLGAKHGVAIPASYVHRKKRFRRAFVRPSLFAGSKLRSSANHKIASCGNGRQAQSKRESPSALDQVITHYLREQHRQCSNPVTTVPPFQLTATHRCPELLSSSLPGCVYSTKSVPHHLNICQRLAHRDHLRNLPGVLAGSYSDAGINRYVFSRYRPYRIIGNHTNTYWGAACSSSFYQDRLLVGNNNGEVRAWDLASDSLVNEWTCHETTFSILDLETNEQTSMGRQNGLMITGSCPWNDFGNTEIACWDLNSMQHARWRLEGAAKPRFNSYGDRLVALDVRHSDNLEWERHDQAVKGALVLDIATGTVVSELGDTVKYSNGYGVETNCCFSLCDKYVLTDGVLWDSRAIAQRRAVHKFDRLSNFGFGFFHPNGNEVIINSAVWDLRTYRLLRMVPALDKCLVKFNSTASALYAYQSFHYDMDDMDKKKNRPKTWFRVLDAKDYRDIATIELEKPIYDLRLDSSNSLISVVEGRYLDASIGDDDPICRLYEIGRKRPSEDDSDVEDGEESDVMDDDEFDDESNSEEDEDDEEDDEEEDDDDESILDGDDVYSLDGDDEDAEDHDPYEDDEEDDEEGEEIDGNGALVPRGLSDREIRFLFEIPEAYYDMHGQYSSEEDDVEEEE